MKIVPTSIADVLLIEPDVHADHRGFLIETWKSEAYSAAGIDAVFVQDNHSRSSQGTLRGLHYQLNQPQGKLVRVVSGEVFNVAVDLRRSSPRFGQWVGVVLTGANHHQLWMPPGFANGYLVLSDSADYLYKCTANYAPADERIIAWDCPEIAIEWPLPDGMTPRLSSKDADAVRLSDADTYP